MHQLFYYSASLLAFRNCHVTAKGTVRFNEVPGASILPRDTMSWIEMEGSKAIIIHTDTTYLVNAQSDAMAGLHHYTLHHFVFQNHQFLWDCIPWCC